MQNHKEIVCGILVVSDGITALAGGMAKQAFCSPLWETLCARAVPVL